VIGKSISQYKIVDKLGQGGMGEVWRASDSKLQRDVALKVLPDEFARNPERMARFRREAQVLASLNHPNIGAIYGLEEVEGIHALVLELVEGPTLGERMRDGQIPVDEAVQIGVQMANALEAAHERGIVHRDLKPDNVKLTGDGRVKVLDFGLAKALEEPGGSAEHSPTLAPTMSPVTGAMTSANVILGTAGYMSPEQARGQEVDRRADIWAFGVCLFEMLSGRRLFLSDNVSDTLASVLKVDPDWESLPPKTPAKLKRLLRRCLERDPKNRLRDIGDARILLEEVQAGGPDEGPEVLVTSAGSRRAGPVVAGGVVLAVVAFLAGWFLGKPAPGDLPVRKFVLPVPDVTAGISSGTTLAFSQDGSALAYTSGDLLWVRELDRLEPRMLEGTGGAIKPFWSPDGEWIAYASGSRLWKIPATGGHPTAICEVSDPFSAAGGGVWQEDGNIVFCHGDGPLLIVSAQGGDPDTLLPTDPEIDDDFHNVIGLPGDRGLVFVVHRKDGPFDRIDVLADGDRREILRHDEQSLSRVSYSPSGHLLYRREPTNAGIWAVPFSLDDLTTTGRPFLAIPDGDLPHVAGDGTLVYAVGALSRTNELQLVDRTGKILDTIGDPRARLPAPSLSPDGRRVVVAVTEEEEDLWILDRQRGTRTRLTFEADDEAWPVWSADGEMVYYDVGESGATFEMRVKAADGTGAALELGRGSLACPSRDGKFLFFSFFDTDRSSWDILYLPLGPDGGAAGERSVFLATDETEFCPRPSPDGRYVAYMSNESGRAEVYLKRFPSGQGKWQVSIDGGAWPQWSADGSELFFAEGREIYAVSVRTDPTLQLGTPEVLFSRAGNTGALPFGWPDGFDVSRSGDFLVVVPADLDESEGPSGLVIAENWFAEFRDGE
jgi:tRNA A-37 threonylcarbamoyl transferase component Bud32/dipeptidyl aminopeptidase/acylaminoacyl peptidase